MQRAEDGKFARQRFIMLSETMKENLNGQVQAELYSSYLYLSMSSYFHSTSMLGAANWMRVQAGEELVHAMKLYDYVISAGGRAIMLPIQAPTSDWGSPLEVFQNVYDHEVMVTGLINDLASLAEDEDDSATRRFLQWYIDEQVEEEESSGSVLQKARSAGDNKAMLQSLDHELGQRRFKFPSGYQIFAKQGSTIGSLK
jgi:ferritin